MGELSTRRRTLSKECTGTIAVLTVAVLIGVMMLVKEVGFGYRSYTVEFAQAAALKSGDVVTVAGIEVGTVREIRLAGTRVHARIRVRDTVAVGRESRAAIKITTLFGSRYVELRPLGEGSPPHGVIDLARTEVPYDLQAALVDSTKTFERVDADRIATSLTVLGKQLDGLPDVVPRAMDNVHALSSVIADRRRQLGELLTSTEQVTSMLRRQQSEVGNVIRRGQDLIGEFVIRAAAFHSMMASLREIVSTLRTIVVHDRAAIDDVIATMEELSGKFAEQDALFRNLLQIAPVPVRQITNATGFGNAVEGAAPGGVLIDSWMCAISGRAEQFGMIPYLKDCK